MIIGNEFIVPPLKRPFGGNLDEEVKLEQAGQLNSPGQHELEKEGEVPTELTAIAELVGNRGKGVLVLTVEIDSRGLDDDPDWVVLNEDEGKALKLLVDTAKPNVKLDEVLAIDFAVTLGLAAENENAN